MPRLLLQLADAHFRALPSDGHAAFLKSPTGRRDEKPRRRAMSGPMRRSLLLLVLMSACGDDDPDMDPAASEHCIAIRAQYIQRKQSLDYNAGLTANSAQILRQSYTQLELFRSQNFECFK